MFPADLCTRDRENEPWSRSLEDSRKGMQNTERVKVSPNVTCRVSRIIIYAWINHADKRSNLGEPLSSTGFHQLVGVCGVGFHLNLDPWSVRLCTAHTLRECSRNDQLSDDVWAGLRLRLAISAIIWATWKTIIVSGIKCRPIDVGSWRSTPNRFGHLLLPARCRRQTLSTLR